MLQGCPRPAQEGAGGADRAVQLCPRLQAGLLRPRLTAVCASSESRSAALSRRSAASSARHAMAFACGPLLKLPKHLQWTAARLNGAP